MHALWLLLATSTLASAILVIAAQRAAEQASLERNARLMLAQEAAVELAIHDIVVRGTRSRWVQAPFVTERLTIDGHSVLLTVQNVSGLLDAASGDARLLEALLSRHLGAEAPSAFRRIENARRLPEASLRPFSGYADLWAAAGLSDAGIACLYPHVTLFSRRSAPDPSTATEALAATLGLEWAAPAVASPLEGIASPAGATYRLHAAAETAPTDPASMALSVEVSVTGQIRPSHAVRSWLRLPGDRSSICR